VVARTLGVTVRLVTIPISHYCEKARWALDWGGFDYREDGHVQLIHWLRSVPLGSRTVPVLVDGPLVVADSTAIVQHLDAKVESTRRLYPDDPAGRAEASRWEEEFDVRLGPHVRRFAYQALFPLGRALAEPLFGHVPPWEYRVLGHAFPLIEFGIRRGLNITAQKAAHSLDRVRSQFDAVGRAIEGRAYLVGDRFGVADLTFASLAAPLLHPPEAPVPLVRPDQATAEFGAAVAELRAHPAGRWALSLYARHRRDRQEAA